MFNFTMKRPADANAASTAPNPTFSFNPPTASPPQNVFGTANTSQPVVFTGATPKAPTTGLFGNPLSMSPGTSVFGTNPLAASAQPTNIFSSNVIGTTIKFNPVSDQETVQNKNKSISIIYTKLQCISGMKEYLSKSMDELRMEDYQANRKSSSGSFTSGSTNLSSTFGPFASASRTTNIFNSSNHTTAATVVSSPFGTNMFQTPGGPFPPAPVSSVNPFTTGANIFTPSTTVNPSNIAANTALAPTSGFPWATSATNPFNTGSSLLNPTANAGASTLFKSGPQSNTSTNVFPQPMSTISFNNPALTTTNTPTSGTLNLFPGLAPSTTVAPSLLPSSTTNPWNSSGSIVTPSTSTLLSSQAPKQEQKPEQTTSISQQNFLAASLLDPYANRGKKDFTNLNQSQILAESTVVSTQSTTTASTQMPITLPIQTNPRKGAPSRSFIDVNFKLKPVSSSPTLSEEIKPSNSPPKVSKEPIKSGLAGQFTDEEELILLGRRKMSKLRISNDTVDVPSTSYSLLSLYPVRRLADLEKFTNITPRASTPPPTTIARTVHHERTSHSASNSRDASPNPRITPSVDFKQQSSPIIQRKSSYSNNQNYRLPTLTRENYYIKPSASELKTLFNDKGECILKQFTVGHEVYGSVTFYGRINVAGLNLDEIIEIKRHEVTVYHDDDQKPSVGEGLNVSARITLFGVYPVDRTTREEITDVERIKAMNYNDYLREVTTKFDGEFVDYGTRDGSWTFMVKHFTRYGLDEDDFATQS